MAKVSVTLISNKVMVMVNGVNNTAISHHSSNMVVSPKIKTHTNINNSVCPNNR
jgi:hypothetical protein